MSISEIIKLYPEQDPVGVAGATFNNLLEKDVQEKAFVGVAVATSWSQKALQTDVAAGIFGEVAPPLEAIDEISGIDSLNSSQPQV